MRVKSFVEFNEKIQSYLNAVPIDSKPGDAIWEEMTQKMTEVTLTIGETGYVLFDKQLASDLIDIHVKQKSKL